ncbi:uncharacterized protein LOC113870091 [Abrus precatorius]|uniref:Uncharacterized protein LOC113870091 n=1 Tax=Abrus precatorius TaxID=3816 RepID=A0A8B8M1T8_ABRPR|nr:uncharacterized protein LOC113870091 [Abrus precatorius]
MLDLSLSMSLPNPMEIVNINVTEGYRDLCSYEDDEVNSDDETDDIDEGHIPLDSSSDTDIDSSIYKIETKPFVVGHQEDNRFRVFERLFWCFHQCKKAFNFCKPIIQIDGTFLYGKYRHTLLIATTQDGNNCILPLAFAIVEGETLPAWEWFLAMIRVHYLYIAAYIPSKLVFEEKLRRFHTESSEIQRWIDNISKEKWALSHDVDGRRYGHMTTNLSEAVNKVLKGARNLPITALVKCTYGRMVEYFVKRGEDAMNDLNHGKRFCSKLMLKMQKNQEEASSHQVRRYDIVRTTFEVEEAFNPITQRGGNKWNVVLCRRYCECGRFQAYRFPCLHVIAACALVSIDFWQYVDDVYSVQNVVHAYSSQWFPLGNDGNILTRNEWKLVPDETRIRGKGRPKSSRIKNEMDWVESQSRT